MTTHDSALDALGERLGDTDSVLAASIAEILTDAIQELIEAEVTARIGAEPGERCTERVGLASATSPARLTRSLVREQRSRSCPGLLEDDSLP
jgi:putative transposase